jgi:transcriptional regulator with XRE-family HTH domain
VEFGERLTALRKARGSTQVQIAERIVSTQRAVSRYETVADRAPAPVLAKLAAALGVNTDELLGGKRTRATAGLIDDPEPRGCGRSSSRRWRCPSRTGAPSSASSTHS